jgi:DNA polymerase I
VKKAVLIDVSAVMYRAYFSLINMRNSKKEPTGAVYGFINILTGILEEFNPEYIVACFDVKRDTLKRREEFGAYKENRESAPEELVVQIKHIESVIDGFGIKRVKIDGHEADDVIGSFTEKFKNMGIESIIVTGDKDLSQLVCDNVFVALLGKGEGKERFKIIKTVEDVKEQLGVYPNQITDLFGLQGDSSDGIPGVKGVGNKTAVKLIEEFGTLENIYENIDSVKGKMKEKLENDKEMAFISRKLATIDRNLEIEFSEEDISKKEINSSILSEIFIKLEFKTLIKKFGFDMNLNFSNVTEEKKKNSINEQIEVKVIKNSEELFQIGKKITLMINGAGAFIISDDIGYYIPLNHNYLGAFNIEYEIFKKSLMGKEAVVYDLKSLIKSGIEFSESFDCMLANYVINPEESYDFEWMINSIFEIELKGYKEEFGKTEEGGVDIDKMAQYLGRKTVYLHNSKEILQKEMEAKNLKEIYEEIELKLVPVLAKVEQKGIKIDKTYFASYARELGIRLAKLEEEIFFTAGREFNLNSPKQLSDILFIDMEMSTVGVKRTKTGISTDTEVLELLASRGETVAEKILDYRKFIKLKTTYLDALPKLTDGNCRIHTTFNQNGTATGRLSSSNPNLQNIPSKTEDGMLIRGGFIAEEGYSLVAFDYSQIELRVLAEISGDKELVEAYENGLDLHTLTAMKIFEKEDSSNITREERTIAKIVNFSIIYGKTPFGLSKEINISMADAKKYIDKYFEEYSGVAAFIKECVKEAEKIGEVKTFFGRKRKIDGITSSNKNIKSQAERMAVNTVIQGTAADILKIVMIKIDNMLKDKSDIKMVLQVHDELIFEIKDNSIEKYSMEIKDIMENSIPFKKVKLEVNFAAGKKWSDTK